MSIAENPLCEIKAELNTAMTFICQSIPSILSIDGIAISAAQDIGQKVVLKQKNYKDIVDAASAADCYRDNPSATSSHPSMSSSAMVITENQEKEFLAALRGDQESTIIS